MRNVFDVFVGPREGSGCVYCSVSVPWSMLLVLLCRCALLWSVMNISGPRRKWLQSFLPCDACTIVQSVILLS